MESVTITINPPITQYCSQCDYEEAYSFDVRLVKCPNCHANLNHLSRSKQSAIYVYQIRERQKQWQYVFNNLPHKFTNRRSFTTDDEIDYNDPLDLAIQLQDFYDDHFITNNKNKIRYLIDYLQQVEDEQYKLRFIDKKNKLEWELYELLSR